MAIVGLVCLLIVPICAYRLYRNVEDRGSDGGLVVWLAATMVLSAFSLISIGTSAPKALKAYVAPRVYVLEKLGVLK